MKGTVKWISKEKGYGFITTPDAEDHFFHVTSVVGANVPDQGDVVTFMAGVGKDGRMCAHQVSIVHSRTHMSRDIAKPYYAKGEYRNYTIGGTKGTWAFRLAIIFPIFIFWWTNGQVFPALFSSILGALIGVIVGKPEEHGSYEITSTCLRCGGTGHVTARSINKIGFQCGRCKSFWKQSDKYY